MLESLFPDGGTLLDVGCGSGDFLAVMQSAPGWRVVGIEPDQQAAEYARRERGLDVRQGQLPQPEIDGAQFDIITLWHVLEHTPAPQATLAEVRRLLKRNGRLIVAVPAGDSWEARAFGRNWAGYDVPRHMVTFTRPSLERLLKGAGFELKEQSGVIRGLASLQVSLDWWLQAHSPFGARIRSLLAAGLLAWVYLWMRLRDGARVGVAVYIARPICED
jgi:SAM-dependent methyltransferase